MSTFPFPLIASFFGLIGLCMGSFGNVVIGRMPDNETLLGYSHCPKCKTRLQPIDLFPVVSWIFLRARCRHCKESISVQYPVIELISALLFVLALLYTQTMLSALLLAIALWSMLLIFIIDVRTQLIPDVLTIILALSGTFYQLSIGSFSLLPLFIGVVFFGLQWVVSKGRWVGSGDILLSGAFGLLLGSWQLMILSLFFAYIIGAVVVLLLLAGKKIRMSAHIAFGPFLVIGALIALFFGQQIFQLLLLA